MHARYPLALVVLTSLALVPAAAQRWDPIPPEDLQATGSTIDPDAAAELLRYEIKYDSTSAGSTTDGYVRAKLYKEAGVAAFSKIEIPVDSTDRLGRVRGRVIKPDGSIVELDPKEVYARELARYKSYRQSVKAFSFPDLGVGDIVEYRWHTTSDGRYYDVHIPLYFRWPVRTVRYEMELRPWSAMYLNFLMHGMEIPGFKLDADKPTVIEQHDLPALREEPYALPDEVIGKWVMLYFTPAGWKADRFWKEWGRSIHDDTESKIAVGPGLRKRAEEVAAGATDPQARLRAIYDYCTTKLRNSDLDAASEEESKWRQSRDVGRIFASGYGNREEVNLVFTALARALGFDARMARVADRSERFFSQDFRAFRALPDDIVAVKMGTDWSFFDPGASYVPFGSLRWYNEDVTALVGDRKDAVFIKTQQTPQEGSKVVRTADLKLDENGNAAGRVTLVYSGHFAIEMKRELRKASDEARREFFTDELVRQLGTVGVSNLSAENLDGSAMPVTVAFDVTAPLYADAAGSRLFVQPAFFQKGQRAVFEADDRTSDIYFPYPWTEEDTVKLHLPEGYAPEEASAPMPIKGGVFLYEPTLGVSRRGDLLIAKRKFGSNGIIFKPEVYPTLKGFFDEVHLQDSHVITLRDKRGEAETPSGETAGATAEATP